MTWRELYRALREKAKAETEDKVKDEAMTWIDLLLLLDGERSFFSLRKESGGKICVGKEKSSKKILGYFFENAWQSPILKTRPSIIQ